MHQELVKFVMKFSANLETFIEDMYLKVKILIPINRELFYMSEQYKIIKGTSNLDIRINDLGSNRLEQLENDGSRPKQSFGGNHQSYLINRNEAIRRVQMIKYDEIE